MSSTNPPNSELVSAEELFRSAFRRLTSGQPRTMPIGTPVTQNNVAREAGVDPSALRKSRYPSLIHEIQQWIRQHSQSTKHLSEPNTKSRRHNYIQELKSRIRQLQIQRDELASVLVEADAKILELTHQIIDLQARAPDSQIKPLHL